MSPNLLVTKLHVPSTRKNLVHRPQLIRLLNEAWQQDKKLILVSASAGYGKTTLVTEWLHDLQTKTTWLSLEDSDNDPARFLAYLIAALQQVGESIGKNTQALLQSPQPLPPEIVLTALINEIAATPTPFLLVLDDYHAIETIPIHQQLGFLVEHQPPQMRLVIITREDPPLPLARLRARGQMTEIRQDDLRFSKEECADFLQRIMGLNLSKDDITALERRTEGWIAGLQLAAVSMQGRDDLPSFIEAFTGGSHYVLDYLIEEVFERQSAEEQDFLLKTSILERLTGPLCDVVVGRADSRSLLERLEHANLFIIPLDQSCTWYRYHHLFADLLKQRLHSTKSISVLELHRLASQWFAKEKFIPEAIHHSLAASDWIEAARLIEDQSVIMLRNGELVSLLGWLKLLPDQVVFERPLLCRDYGWALTLTGQLDVANIYLRQAEDVSRGDNALLGTVMVAQAYYLRVRGDIHEAIERAQLALSLLPATDPLSRGLVALTLGLIHWNRGNLPEAEHAFIEVDQAAQQSQNHYARLTALTYLGMIQAIYGHLHKAAELCRQVIHMGEQFPPVAPAHIELGALLYEWNDLESAAHHLHTGIELSERTGNLLIQSDGYRTLAILHQACGRIEEAMSTIEKADHLAESHQVSPLMRVRNAAYHVQLALAQRDLVSAEIWADQVTDTADSSLLYPRLSLTPVRLLIAHHKYTEAAERLSALFETAKRAGWGSGVVEVRALQALTAPTPTEALQFLEDALTEAQPEGLIRTFVDKGEPMKALLERLRSQGGDLKEYITKLLSAFGKPTGALSMQPLIEQLSDRELEVLRFLDEGMSNGEIATRLVVSVGTVKTHVHSIITKLDVSSRMQAVVRAKELKLL